MSTELESIYETPNLSSPENAPGVPRIIQEAADRQQSCREEPGCLVIEGLRAVCGIKAALPRGLIDDSSLINRRLTSDAQALWVGSGVQGH
jgi:hypothetical protein